VVRYDERGSVLCPTAPSRCSWLALPHERVQSVPANVVRCARQGRRRFKGSFLVIRVDRKMIVAGYGHRPAARRRSGVELVWSVLRVARQQKPARVYDGPPATKKRIADTRIAWPCARLVVILRNNHSSGSTNRSLPAVFHVGGRRARLDYWVSQTVVRATAALHELHLRTDGAHPYKCQARCMAKAGLLQHSARLAQHELG
jgi:hypothetical protein